MHQTWQEFVRGSDSSFTLVYKTYFKNMIAYGIVLGFCEQLCKDAVQDVFCTIYDSRKKLGDVENVKSYLLQCLKYRLFDIYKKRKKIGCISCDSLIIDLEEDLMNKIIDEENQMLIDKEVERLLNKLPPKQRKIVYCRFHHNLKFNEIAVVMGMSSDATKKLLYRTLKTMRRESDASSRTCSYFF